MPPVINRGKIINFIAGLNGVAAGGQAILNVPTNARYHGLILNCTSSGSAIAVGTIISSIKLIVNGTPVRDISPTDILKMAQAQGYYPLLGELPLWFTEPLATGQNIIEPSDCLAWDMFGQSTFQIQIGIQSGATAPAITGNWIFDYDRTKLPDGSLVLQPVAQHAFTFPVAIGVTPITTIPFDFPIRRLYLQGSSAGTITQVDIYQDNNKVHEALTLQGRQYLKPYGFVANNMPDKIQFRNATGPADLAVSALLETPAFYDYIVAFDPDGRWWRSLKCAKTFEVRITSSSAQNVTVVQETLPGAYK